MDELSHLKVQAYDCLAVIETYQKKLVEINSKIMSLTAPQNTEKEVGEVKKDDTSTTDASANN